MATRNVRKMFPLEIRGISRSSLEVQPLGDRGIEQGKLVHAYDQKGLDQYDPYSNAELLTSSGAIGQSNYLYDVIDDVIDDADGAEDMGSPDSDSKSSTSTVSDWLVRCHGGRPDVVESSTGGGPRYGPGNVGWGTGNTTDRTSLSSSDWGDDICEFDRQEARRVRQMFEDIERILFDASGTNHPSSSADPSHLLEEEERVIEAEEAAMDLGILRRSPGCHLLRECREWVGRFPHFRLLGNQLLAPQDPGFCYYPMPPGSLGLHSIGGRGNPNNALMITTRRSNSAEQDSGTAVEQDCMSLLGRRMEPNSPPLTARTEVSSRGSLVQETEAASLGPLEGEILVQDGEYEEIIAIDYKLMDEESQEKKILRRRHHGYPPLTPNAALRDTIVSALFDIQWSEVATWMRPLVKTARQSALQDQAKALDVIPVGLPLQISARPDLGLPSRETSFTRLSRGSAQSSSDPSALAGLLHISIKTLQQRERSILYNISEAGLTPTGPPALPSTSRPDNPSKPTAAGPGGRPNSVRPQASTSEPRVNSARGRARVIPPIGGRLVPLDRTKAGAGEFGDISVQTSSSGGLFMLEGNSSPGQTGLGLLRGRGLHGPQVEMITRSKTLPPLGGVGSLYKVSSGLSARVGSAMGGAAGSANQSSTLSGLVGGPTSNVSLTQQTERPSTTQTSRSETPQARRNSTPLGGRAGQPLGIHGSGFGAQPHLMEEEERSMQASWGSTYTAPHLLNNPYRRGKVLGYTVR